MKKKKVTEKENEWKGVLQAEIANVKKEIEAIDKETKTTISPNEDYVRIYGDKPIAYYNPDDTQQTSTNFYQVGESNVTPDSFTVTSTNVGGEINLKEFQEKQKDTWSPKETVHPIEKSDIPNWNNIILDKNGSDYDIDKDYCNVGVNKDWGVTKEELSKICHDNFTKENINYKQKRIDFEFTPLTFWQLTPSIAVNLSMKEIEFVWLCFGMYINFKRNG